MTLRNGFSEVSYRSCRVMRLEAGLLRVERLGSSPANKRQDLNDN